MLSVVPLQEPRALLSTLVDLAEQAGKLVLGIYQTEFTVDHKGPSDPVTEADRQANALICSELSKRFPEIPIVAEESPRSHYAGFETAPYVFFVDPVDGTSDFVKRNGEFVVMIGLAHEGHALAGVIHAPVAHRTWSGFLSLGAWVSDRAGAAVPIRVSESRELSLARVVQSRSHRSERLEPFLAQAGITRSRHLGSAGLKSVAIAEGSAELYLQLGLAGARWDACASEAITVAAGGRVTDERGENFRYDTPDIVNHHGLVVTNGLLHDAVLRMLERSDASLTLPPTSP